MPENVNDESTEMRSEYSYELARAAQNLLCELLMASNEQVPRILKTLERLPSPKTRVEELFFEGLMIDVALGCVSGPKTDRAALMREVMITVLSTQCRKPLLDATPEERAACYIARRYTSPLDIGATAKHVGCEPTKLRHLFRCRYAMTMREYHVRLRVRDAMRRFASGQRDILSVLRSVGYMSEKNFYKAVRQLTQRTPARLAALSACELSQLSDAILPSLIGCVPACSTCLLQQFDGGSSRTRCELAPTRP